MPVAAIRKYTSARWPECPCAPSTRSNGPPAGAPPRANENGPDPESHPQRLRGQAARFLAAARAGGARHHRGRRVRKEVEDRERAREHGAREPEHGDLRRTEMADDRGVGEHVQGLRRERAESRQREPEDLAVVDRAEPQGPPT